MHLKSQVQIVNKAICISLGNGMNPAVLSLMEKIEHVP